MDHKFGTFYVVSHGRRPPRENRALLLDTNVISKLDDWSTKVTAASEDELRPFLDLIREGDKVVEPFWGALEAHWTLHRKSGVPLTAENFDQLNNFKLKTSLLTIETIRTASESHIRQWTSPARKGTIEFVDIKSTRLANMDFSSELIKPFTQAIIPEWYAFMTLINSLRELAGNEDRDQLLDAFIAWRDDLRVKGVPLRSAVIASGIWGFFGGHVHHRYWDVRTKAIVTGKRITKDVLLKSHEWESLGVAKVSRNLAFDAMLFHRRTELESGMRQAADSLEMVNVERLPTGIVTSDAAISALNQLITQVVPIEGHLDALVVNMPDGSLISPGPEHERYRKRLSSTTARSPHDLPVNDELVPLLIAQLELESQ